MEMLQMVWCGERLKEIVGCGPRTTEVLNALRCFKRGRLAPVCS